MAKSKDYVVLRHWDCGNAEISLSDVRTSFKDIIDAIGGQQVFLKNNGGDSFMLCSANESYMPVNIFTYWDNGSLFVDMAVIGKGEQIKAEELESLYRNAMGALSNLYGGYQQSKYFMRRFGASSTASSLTAGVSVAVGAAIGGSVKLMAKGVRALLRNKEAYDKEMAFYTLALSYGDFLIGAINSESCFEKINESAHEGNYIAQYLLASSYLEGRCTDIDETQAIYWFAIAANNGEKRSREILAMEYLYGERKYTIEEKETGLTYLKEMADNGDEDAAVKIIDVFGTGNIEGIPADINKMIALAETYASRNNLYACMLLASVYDSAKTSTDMDTQLYKDDQKALNKYVQVIQNGNSEYLEEAAMSLAWMYREARGTDENKAEELNCYEIAASKGNIEAKAILTQYYTLGIGTDKDHNKAQKLCKEITKSGNQAWLPVVYYCSYVIADEAKKYKVSMDNARKYINCVNVEEEKVIELQKYLAEQEELISKMTDDERREYLQERKPLFNGFKGNINVNKKVLAIIVGLILLLTIGIFVIKGIGNNSQSEANYSSEGGTVATSSSNYSMETECQETDVFINDDTEILVRTEVDIPTITGNEVLNSGVQDWANNYVEQAESFRNEYSDFNYDDLEYMEPHTDSEFYGTDYPVYFYSRNVIYVPEADSFLTNPRADDKVLSLIYNSYSETGGAHGFSSFDGANFDVETGELLSFEAIATDYDSFSNKVLTSIINEIEVKAQEIYIFEGYEDTIYSLWYDNTTAWYMSDAGFVFIYSPYTLASYADGSIVVEVPYEDVDDYMDNKYLK